MDEIPVDWWERYHRQATLQEWKDLTFLSVRENLRDIPDYPLAEGYRIRSYRPGDCKAWVRIWQAASLRGWDWATDETFNNDFGSDLKSMPKRCLFVVTDDGTEVATTTAWHQRVRGVRWGQVHWFATVPDHQGRGLGKAILAESLRRMRSLGHRRAMVGTQLIRLPAIKTYLNLGFVPEDPAIRKLLAKYISHPALTS